VKHLVPLLSGFAFAVGLALSGMTRPEKVVGFLDFAGQWDPALLFVMGGAVLVYAIAWRLRLRRTAPLWGPSFPRLEKARIEGPANAESRPASIDRRLLLGAALFGVGWALAGMCPGPGIASLAVGGPAALVFVVAMAAGWFLVSRVDRALVAARGAG
jgi:uncharacterized membrane protein YedE/YeeE